jgi:hypothetical protein
MSELRNRLLSDDGWPTGSASGDRNRGAELAAQADLRLAQYPDHVREQITELLRVLAGEPGAAGTGVR